jgi:hypothetical protein
MRDRYGPRARLRLVSAVLVAGGLCAHPSSAIAQTDDDHQEHQMTGATPPETTVRAFGSFDWAATRLRDVPNSFSLGQLTLFVTSTLNERVSVLAEVVLEGGVGTRVETDLERLQVTFRWNDSFHVSGGRYHTGIGFYNTAFHHATYFETAIGRPRVFAFEDHGGVLPVHELGVTAGGVVPHSGSSLRYLAEVGDGRAWTPAETDGVNVEGRDLNDAKSTNVALSYQPDQWPGFEAGASYYRDKIPQTAASAVDHHVGAIYAVYRTPSTEVMAEWLTLAHATPDGAAFHNHAGYVQASRAWGKLRPYYRYDRLDIDPATPFIGTIGSYKAHIAGLRVDPADSVAFKVQYERTDEAGQRGVSGVRAQVAFLF